MVQKFHSIHEIDPEFIPNIEVLLQEEVAGFHVLKDRQDQSPKTTFYTYFLFFGPTQNTPIGFAQLSLKAVPFEHYLPWHRKLKFWNKDHEHWKQLSWQIGTGSSGVCVFDSKFSRTGKEKVNELIKEYEVRDDIVAQEIFCLKGLQDFTLNWSTENQWTKESYVLEPLTKAHKTYKDYLSHLDKEMQGHLKESWKRLHGEAKIKLGDYSSPLEVTGTSFSEEQLATWTQWGGQLLTFEKSDQVLGCLLVLKGKNGNVFFEPFPFEPEGEAVVPDEIYTQYAILKFFEMPEARKCHLMKFGTKLFFEEKEDLKFFESQGFQLKTVIHQFQSRLSDLRGPL